MSNPCDGLIVPINKPPGISSFGVVRRIKKATGIKKVGHGGTLDPFAEGVLIVGIGRSATKRLGDFLKGDKEYLAEVVLGVVTDTYDLTGKVIQSPPPFISPPGNRGGAVRVYPPPESRRWALRVYPPTETG